ncbi:sulfoacetaldehyde acetyltransferase, partial [Paracoccus sp. (in: a-proteobacteria)]
RLFADCVCYQEEVRDPSRIPEVLNRVIMQAWRNSAPAQMNIPRDFWTQVIDVDLPQVVAFERPAGGERAVGEAAALLSAARFPVILSGAGVVLSGAIPDLVRLAERLDAPVCSNYQHNDSFPGSHPLAMGPLGYNGSKAGMEIIARADVVLALGTRLNPFSTLPGYGIDYWPKDAKIIQVDINADRIGLTKKVTVGIQGDAGKVARGILAQLADDAGDAGRQERRDLVAQTKSRWAQELSSLDHEDDDPGTEWNAGARRRDADLMSPRQAWRAIMQAMPQDAIVSSDIGNNCAIGNAYPTFEAGRKYLAPGLFGPCGYGFPAILGAKIGNPDVPVIGFAGDGAFGISMNEMTACGRDDWPAITMVIFRNYQWGAEKRNTTLWYDNNFVGTELDRDTSYAGIAQACGVTGVQVKSQEDLTRALHEAVEAQMRGETTFIEVILNQELGEPFRRDAMKKPVPVAGIDAADMRPQKGAA